MHFELIMGMVKQLHTQKNGRAELPWEMLKKSDQFVPISQKPEKLTFQEYDQAVNSLTTVNLIPRHLQLERVLRIPREDNRLADMLATLRNRKFCLLYTSPSPRDKRQSRMPSSA